MSRSLLVLAALFVLALLAVPVAATPSLDGGDGWYEVRFGDRITAEDRRALGDLGAGALLYEPDHAYLAWLSESAAEEANGLERVEAVRALEPADKVDEALADRQGVLRTDVTVYGAEADEASAVLTTLGTVQARYPAQADGALEILAVDLHATALLAAATAPEVLHVGPGATALIPEDEGTAQTIAGNLDELTPVPGYEDFLAEIGLDGSGATLSILDTGIDDKHPDFEGRIVDKIEYGAVPVVGEPDDTYGHGTHVAGIAAGAAADIPALGRIRDEDGLLYGMGVAPGLNLVDQNAIATTSGSFPPAGGWEQLTSDALRAGAFGWNASLHSGEGTGAGYIASARSLDVLTRDGDFDEAGNQPFTMVWSAGNSGPGEQTMTSPKEAKNIITVGSTMSHRAGHIDFISGFSSRGPAVDGRILPTVVAPGQTVASANTLPAGATTALCVGLLRDAFGFYVTCSGTSMAAPHVAGTVGLIHEWWGNTHDGVEPSPALSKALLVNTADDVGFEPIPNNDEGWGRVNLATLFDDAVDRVYVDEDVVLTEVDDTWELEVSVTDPGEPLKVSLAWTDAPGAPGADPALVNDLDLVVTGPDGRQWLGNVFADGMSVTGGDPDRLNNLENVFVADPEPGTYRITVTAANLPEPAIPGHPSDVNQDFALIVSNATTP